MKTYEEMAQSVMRRAKTHRRIRNRCILGITAVVCVLGICLGVMALKDRTGTEATLQIPTVTDPAPAVTDPAPTIDDLIPDVTDPPPTVTVPPVIQSNTRLTLLCRSGNSITQMPEDVTTPYRMEIRVQDISGLTEDEANAVCEAEKEYANEVIASYPKSRGYQWVQSGGENVVMTSISAGHFILAIDDPSLLESIHVTVGGTVQLTLLPGIDGDLIDFSTPPTEYGLDAAEVRQYYYKPYGGIPFSWYFSSWLFPEYDRNPVPLSNYADTISITATFKDGTVENHTIDLVFTDDGKVYAIYHGTPTAV